MPVELSTMRYSQKYNLNSKSQKVFHLLYTVLFRMHMHISSVESLDYYS